MLFICEYNSVKIQNLKMEVIGKLLNEIQIIG